MSYRNEPCGRPVTICDVTSETKLHMLNGVTAEFAVPCSYVVPVEGTNETELVPIRLRDEGYNDPLLAISPSVEGLTWAAWIDDDDDSIIRFVISAQCPSAVNAAVEVDVALLIARTTQDRGDRIDAVLRGPLLIEASPLTSEVPLLPNQPAPAADRIMVDATDFNGMIPNTATTLQEVLDALDDHVHPGDPSIPPLPDSVEAPVGSIMLYAATDPAPPYSWLFCDGSEHSRTTEAKLFSVIGTTYGNGNGSTTFNVPDLRGLVPVGLNPADSLFNALGKTGGSKDAVVVEHSHHLSKVVTGGGSTTGPLTGTYVGTHSTHITGVNGTNKNLQPFITLQYIIKAFRSEEEPAR